MSAIFDEQLYLQRNPDVAAAILRGELASAAQHFQLYGQFENRAPSAFFDPQLYLSANPDVATAIASGQLGSAFQHFQAFGIQESRNPSAFFDANFYLSSNPDIAAAVAAGQITAFQHFLEFGLNEVRETSPFFDIDAYLTANPDIAAAVSAGTITAYQHFTLYGFTEGRDLGNGISLEFFASDPQAQAAIAAGDFEALFARVAEVAPFVPGFQTPDGYSIPANQPLPQNFVPNDGQNLVVPEGVVVPPGTELPGSFEPPVVTPPVTPPPSGGGGGGTPSPGDTTAPIAPTLTLTEASDSGVKGDGITNLTPVLAGTVEAGAKVEIFNGNVSLGQATVTGTTFTFTATGLTGSANLTAKATDAAGNTSAASAPLAVTVDTTVDAPTLTLTEASDSGAKGDGITNLTPVLAGTVEAGSKVEIFNGDVSLGQAVVDGTTFTFTATGLTGSANLTAKATDAAGNLSAASAPLAVTIDTTAPNAPTLTLTEASDSGVKGDGITNLTPVLAGTVEAGSKVEIFNGDVSLGQATVTGTTFTFTATGLTGSANLTAKATDAAGNLSAASAPLAVTVDTTVDAPTLTLTEASDSGVKGDGITNLTPVLAGTVEAGSKVEIFNGDVSLGQAVVDGTTFTFTATGLTGSANLTAKATDAAGNLSAASAPLAVTVDTTVDAPTLTLTEASDSGVKGDGITNLTPVLAGTVEAGSKVEIFNGDVSLGQAVVDGTTFTFTATGLTGSANLTAKATDAAGNLSAASAPLAVTVDTTVDAPTLTLTEASDSGVKGDGITNLTPVLAGTVEAGSKVEIFNGDVSLGQATVTGTTFTFTATGLTGSANLTAKATDAAGNLSAASAPLAVTIDTTAPNAPTLTLTEASDSGVKGDGITNLTPVLAGTVEAGSKVEIFNGDVSLGQAVVDGTTFTFTATGLTGSANLTAKATDAAGNLSAASAPLAVTVDTTVDAPTLTLTEASDSGVKGDGITNLTPALAGTVEAGSKVEIFNGDVSLGQAVVDGTTFTFTATGLTGSANLTAKATDAAGNTSAASAPLAVTVDTTAPVLSRTLPEGTAVQIDTNIELTFSEAVKLGNGTISVTNTSNNNVLTFTVGSEASNPGNVYSNETRITLDPTDNLAPGTEYTVTYTAGAIQDLAGNDVVALTGNDFSFTTDGI